MELDGREREREEVERELVSSCHFISIIVIIICSKSCISEVKQHYGWI